MSAYFVTMLRMKKLSSTVPCVCVCATMLVVCVRVACERAAFVCACNNVVCVRAVCERAVCE